MSGSFQVPFAPWPRSVLPAPCFQNASAMRGQEPAQVRLVKAGVIGEAAAMRRFTWLAPATGALAAGAACAWWLIQSAPVPATTAAPIRLARATGAEIS